MALSTRMRRYLSGRGQFNGLSRRLEQSQVALAERGGDHNRLRPSAFEAAGRPDKPSADFRDARAVVRYRWHRGFDRAAARHTAIGAGLRPTRADPGSASFSPVTPPRVTL